VAANDNGNGNGLGLACHGVIGHVATAPLATFRPLDRIVYAAARHAA